MNAPTIIAHRYEVLDSLGRGGFGSVFKVKDLETQDTLALKYLSKDDSTDLDARRFEREFQHLARLQHPHIVSVKDTGTDGGACYFTMEYLEGVTLEEALKSPNTGLYQVLQNGSDVFREILVQICEALACIHAQGLVHRDLKPANIFLQSDQNGPHVKILDLGLVKFREDGPSPLTEEGTMLGTVHYMSPEQIRGVHVDHRSDLYTLGVVLYEVLTGQKPFLGQNSAAVVLKHLNEVPVPPRVYNLDISHDLQLVVLKLLEKEPERRYRFANDLIADLVPTKSHPGRKMAEYEPSQLLQHPRFLGRPEEMAQARQLLTDVQAGKGRALSITGPAGIGKTRFLEEIKADAKLRGFQVLHATCFEDRTAPFQPIIECVRSIEKQLGGLEAWVRDEDRNELARLFPELGDIDEIAHRSNLRPLNQEDLFIALLQLFKDFTHRTSLVLAIDDVQWMDEGTRDFIDFLSGRLNLLPIFLCMVQRSQEKNKYALNKRFERLDLEPLGLEGTQNLIASMFSTEDIPQKCYDDIFEFSGGNPFAALEITKTLFSNKAILYEQNKWTYQTTSETLPAELETALMWRVGLLSKFEQQILNHVVVINRPFEFQLIATFLECDEANLYEHLERLVQYRYLSKDSFGHYSILHGLFAQIIYEHISLNKQKELHLKLAQKLVDTTSVEPVVGEIAHHFLRADCKKDAWPYLVQVGDRASITYSFIEAKTAYEQALDIVDNLYSSTSDTYLDVVCKYIEVLRWLFDWELIEKTAVKAFDQRGISPYYYAYLARFLSTAFTQKGKLSEAKSLLLDVLKDISDTQYDILRVYLYVNLVNVYWATGQYQEATRYSEAAVGLCQNSVQPFYRTFGSFLLAHDHLTNSRFGAAETAFNTALEEFQTIHKDKRFSQQCNAALREIYTYRGRFQKAEKLSLRVIETSKNAGLPSFIMFETLDLGYIYFLQNKYKVAEEHYLTVVEPLLKQGETHKLCLAYVRLSELYLALGDQDKAWGYASLAKKNMGADLTRKGQVYQCLGKVYAGLNKVKQAEGSFEKCITLFKKVQGFHFALALLESGSFYLDKSNKEIAKTHIGQALDMFKKMGADHFFKQAQTAWNRLKDDELSIQSVGAIAKTDQDLDTSQLLNEAIDRLLQITQADRGLILRVENGKPRLQTACSRHLDTTRLNDISTTVVQAAVESGTLIITTDASNDPRFEESLSIADSNVGSILCMPLKARNGNVIGVVYADRAGDVVFDAQAISFFKSFAAFVAVGLEHALRSDQLQIDLEKFSGLRTQMDGLVGVSEAMQGLYETIERLAHTDMPILLQGETGVGKGLVARTIHNKSLRATNPFLSINCGALQRELLGSELFGHKKGAFTDASADRPGLFEAAQGGTLFLDEIGEASLDVQVQLLHVLEDKMVRRIGENESRSVDVRVIAATNRDLAADVEAGKFRQDLFFRLNVMNLVIPPLRDRADDVLLLAKHFLAHWNNKLDKKLVDFDARVRQVFLRYDWPGNIRELENVVYRSVALAENGGQIGIEHLPDTLSTGTQTISPRQVTHSLKAEMANYETELIGLALKENDWNVTATAEKLGLSRVALGQKIKKHGLKRPK